MDKNKRSQGHVEMIISFVIFVGFILTMFIFLNPVNQEKTSYASLDLVQDSILSNLSSEIVYIPLVTNKVSSNCFIINNSFNLSGNILVKDFEGNLVFSKLDANKIYIKNVSSKLYNLYFSNKISNYSTSFSGCEELTSAKYSFGVLVVENKIFFENIQNLNQQYVMDYSVLKNSLKIRDNFDFRVYNLTRSIILNDSLIIHKFRNGDNLVREIPLRVINNKTSEQDVIFSLRVW